MGIDPSPMSSGRVAISSTIMATGRARAKSDEGGCVLVRPDQHVCLARRGNGPKTRKGNSPGACRDPPRDAKSARQAAQ
jgi:hypothetical protein